MPAGRLGRRCAVSTKESSWTRRPVVASAVGAIQDRITDGRGGLQLRDPTDLAGLGAALGTLLREPRESAALGAAETSGFTTAFSGPAPGGPRRPVPLASARTENASRGALTRLL